MVVLVLPTPQFAGELGGAKRCPAIKLVLGRSMAALHLPVPLRAPGRDAGRVFVQGDLGKSIATRRAVLQDVYDAATTSCSNPRAAMRRKKPAAVALATAVARPWQRMAPKFSGPTCQAFDCRDHH